MRIGRWLATCALATLAAGAFTGCNTAAGKYFADRAADFGDCWRLQAGAGFGVGASVRTAGHLDLGLSIGSFPREWGLGWDYGTGYAFGYGETGLAYDSEVNLSAVVVPIVLAASSNTNTPSTGIPIPMHWNTSAAAYSTFNPLASTHGCFGFFPGLLGWVNRRDVRADKDYGKGNRSFWLWSGRAIKANKWEHIHAFDVEATVMAGVVRVSAGFSPGEFVDFVLGWFGLDIARDDGRWDQGAPSRAPFKRDGETLRRRPSLR